ncbi:MAG: Mrp/NBP35 family ATP-binding protein [Gaiellaceae bacterium]|jgi:ATP-binding protein involved in chromosome partitioning
MALSRVQIELALRNVVDPELGKPVTVLGMVRGIEIDAGTVRIKLALTIAGCPLKKSFEEQVQQHVGAVPGVESVELSFEEMTAEQKVKLRKRLGIPEKKGIAISEKTRVLAVTSGKGGVGKSSISVNLAAALSLLGEQVGVLDADIYGHSVPQLLGVTQRPVAVDEMIVPPLGHGLRLMSIGFFIDENKPVIWRGPMLHKALEQFLSDVHWGEIDTLVVDMPPGTGDVAISLGQLLPRAEAIVVTTPQPLAQEVAARAALMAIETGMHLLGVIENMSYLVGSGQEVFGSGGGERLADELEIPLLGRVPLDPALRECGENGEPVSLGAPESEAAVAIASIAKAVAGSRF